eukprot:2837885-Prymnesium_polylepis.2
MDSPLLREDERQVDVTPRNACDATQTHQPTSRSAFRCACPAVPPAARSWVPPCVPPRVPPYVRSAAPSAARSASCVAAADGAGRR